jgi:hypothetical protein
LEWIRHLDGDGGIGDGHVSLVVDALTGDSESDAIDNGNKPRIAIVLTSPIPFVSRVTAYVVDTPMAWVSIR